MHYSSLFSDHHFELSSEENILFEKFLSLFIEYNSHTNLSAIRDEQGIVEKHFIDSLYGADIIANYISEWTQMSPRLLDIWSGWGFPWIPLKIVLPNLQVTLLDSVGKKVKAMNYFISELGLTEIRATQSRAEELAKLPDEKWQYDFIVSRATAYITDILTWAKPFLKKDGKIILYKMPSDEEARDRGQIMKTLGLVLEAELEYLLAEKQRVIYVFSKK